MPRLVCDFDDCGKTYKTSTDLKRHWGTHTGEKPYACSWDGCRATFLQKSGLDTHIRTHTGEKPFQCETCPVDPPRFADNSSYKRHLKEKHNMQEPYACPVAECGSRIKRLTAFKNHLRIKHQIDPRTLNLKDLRGVKHLDLEPRDLKGRARASSAAKGPRRRRGTRTRLEHTVIPPSPTNSIANDTASYDFNQPSSSSSFDNFMATTFPYQPLISFGSPSPAPSLSFTSSTASSSWFSPSPSPQPQAMMYEMPPYDSKDESDSLFLSPSSSLRYHDDAWLYQGLSSHDDGDMGYEMPATIDPALLG